MAPLNPSSENDLSKLISDQLTKLLGEKNISIVDLCEKTGLSRTNIYSILNGKADIRLQTLNKIAIALEVPLTSFFSEIDSQAEKLNLMVSLLSDKITLLEIQRDQLQNATEMAEMKYKLLVDKVTQNAKDQQDHTIDQHHDLKLVADNKVEYQHEQIEPDPRSQLNAMIKEINKKIAKEQFRSIAERF